MVKAAVMQQASEVIAVQFHALLQHGEHAHKAKLLAQSRDRTLVPPHAGATSGCRSAALGRQGGCSFCLPKPSRHLQASPRQGKLCFSSGPNLSPGMKSVSSGYFGLLCNSAVT
jgi:hypothetical protein